MGINVLAVGDCASKRDFFTRKAAPVWLASTPTAEARAMQEQISMASVCCIKSKGRLPPSLLRSAENHLPAQG
jgi:hypothetical protein